MNTIPTSTDVSIEVISKPVPSNAAVAVMVTKGDTSAGDASALLTAEQIHAVERLVQSGLSQGKTREIQQDLIAAKSPGKKGKDAFGRVFVAGVGDRQKLTAEMIRQAAGSIARASARLKLANVAVVVPAFADVRAEHAAEAIVTGFTLAVFKYLEYRGAAAKSDKENDNGNGNLAPWKVKLTLICPSASAAAVRQAASEAKVVADAQNFCRTIATRPGNDINPVSLAKVVQDMARQAGLGCRVLDDKQMTKLGMGGILAVGSASATPPRMIALEYNGLPRNAKNASQKPLLVVGKAITFDAGGISIKPAEKMGRMVFDKCGGMAVMGFMLALAKLKLPLRVVGILSAAENTLGKGGYRPGDILRMYNGVTVEVTNTDAEGRLVLADALAWGIETYKPAAVVDLATLTGGVIVALGHSMAGILCNHDGLLGELMTAARVAGEKIWRLPVEEEHRELLKSDFADIVNSGGRPAHSSQGAAFLSHFATADGDPLPWAHIDIAGVADTEKELPYYGKGATGWGVRLLVSWAKAHVKAR